MLHSTSSARRCTGSMDKPQEKFATTLPSRVGSRCDVITTISILVSRSLWFLKMGGNHSTVLRHKLC